MTPAMIVAAIQVAREAADLVAQLRAAAEGQFDEDTLAQIDAAARASDDRFDDRVALARRRLQGGG